MMINWFWRVKCRIKLKDASSFVLISKHSKPISEWTILVIFCLMLLDSTFCWDIRLISLCFLCIVYLPWRYVFRLFQFVTLEVYSQFQEVRYALGWVVGVPSEDIIFFWLWNCLICSFLHLHLFLQKIWVTLLIIFLRRSHVFWRKLLYLKSPK